MNNTCRFVSIAIAAVDIPDAGDSKLLAPTHLTAIGLLIAERDGDAWQFTLKHQAIAAGSSEKLLLAWATRALPDSGTLIGWQLADDIVQPLIAAGSEGDPEIARRFFDRLMQLVTAPTIDLALHHGGAGAPPLALIAGEHGIETPRTTLAEIESAWAFGERELLRGHVAAQVIATWRLWLAESNGIAAAASAAFERWLA